MTAVAVASVVSSETLVDRVMAVAHLPPSAHVAVIGHHTLSVVLALMHRGCAVRAQPAARAASPDREAADLAWIVDVANEDELHDALQAARNRTGTTGRVIVEGADCPCTNGLAAIRTHALAAGLDVVSFDHVARRLVLAPVQSTRLAA